MVSLNGYKGVMVATRERNLRQKTNIADVRPAADDTLGIGSPYAPSAVQLRHLSETTFELEGLTYSGSPTIMRITLA